MALIITPKRWSQSAKPLIPTVNWGHPSAFGLKHWWLFHEGSGTTIHDLVQNSAAWNLQPNTLTPSWSVGLHGPSWNVPLVSAGFTAPAGSNPFANAVYSVATWVLSPSTSGSYCCVFSARTGDADETSMFFSSNTDTFYASKIWFGAYGSAARVAAISNANYATSTWYHIVGTCDGTTCRMYLNGVKQTDSTLLDFSTFAVPLNLCQRNNAAFPLTSQISDFRIWNRCLTADEAMGLYTQPWAMLNPQSPGHRIYQPAIAAAGGTVWWPGGVVVGGGVYV